MLVPRLEVRAVRGGWLLTLVLTFTSLHRIDAKSPQCNSYRAFVTVLGRRDLNRRPPTPGPGATCRQRELGSRVSRTVEMEADSCFNLVTAGATASRPFPRCEWVVDLLGAEEVTALGAVTPPVTAASASVVSSSVRPPRERTGTTEPARARSPLASPPSALRLA